MTQRRTFFKTAALGATAAILSPTAIANTTVSLRKKENILPKRLKKGATIGLVAPGYTLAPEKLEKAKDILRAHGFTPYHTDRIHQPHGYLSNTDAERAADVNEMFANPNVDAILCARGGYGCTRILEQLNFETIQQNPKLLLGFSDITALLNAIHSKTGLVTFHGPVGSTIENDFSFEQLLLLLSTPTNNFSFTNATLSEEQFIHPEYDRYLITKGKAEGSIVGGSLTLVNALIGTPYEIDFTNKIVLLEDVGEAPYRIDRMLTQLIDGPTFKKASGIVFGVFADCDKPKTNGSFTLREVLLDRIKPLNIPAAYGFSFGHVPQNFTFPIGVLAKFNSKKMHLELTETSVS